MFTDREREIIRLRNTIFSGPDTVNVPREQEVDGAINPKHQDGVTKREGSVNCWRFGKSVPLNTFSCGFEY